MSKRSNRILHRIAGALMTLMGSAVALFLVSRAAIARPSIEALTLAGVPSTSLAMFGLMVGQIGVFFMLYRLSVRLGQMQQLPAPAASPAFDEGVTFEEDEQPGAVLPRTPQNIALELAVMSDSVQRFLVWMRAHGMSGEQVWSNLQSLYDEFCEMTGDEPEDMRVLGKRLLQCGCEKPPMKNTLVNGKRVRKQFYIIPERSIEPPSSAGSALTHQQEENRDAPPTTIKLAA